MAEFSRGEYEFYVEEEQSWGEVFVGQVVAIDRDQPPHNDVVYTLLFPPSSVHDVQPPFRIVAGNGTIFTTQSLDREVTDNFRFVARACSLATDACSAAHVTVHVTDVNDHAPAFLLPATPNDSVSATSHFRPGDVIATLVATDADAGDNGRVGYRLLGADDHVVDFYFRLDDVTGDILARRDGMATGSYTLVVAAVDAGNPPRSVQSALTIVVNVSTSGEPRPRWASGGSNSLTIVIVIVGTSLPVAILLLAAILVLLRQRRHVTRPGVMTSQNGYDSKSTLDGVATSQEYATLSRRPTTRLATTAAAGNDLDQPRSTINSTVTPLTTNNVSFNQV